MLQPYRLRWEAALPDTLFTAPLAGSVVVAAGSFEVVGLDPATGVARWNFSAGGAPRSVAWAVSSADGPVVCAGTDRLWRITGLADDGAKRFSVLLEGWGSEAAAMGGHTYVLYTREDPHSGLWELDGAGALRRRWEVPAGAFSLSASGQQLCFAARAVGHEGLYQVRLDTGELRRLVAGKVAWVECRGAWVLFQRAEGPVTLCDGEGRVLWETAGGGLSSHLAADGVYGAEAEGEVWAAVCRELSTGALRWRHPLPEAGRYLKVVPWGESVVLWDAGPLIFVDRRSGAHLQTFPGDYTDVGPLGCGDDLLVAAAGAGVHAIERSGA